MSKEKKSMLQRVKHKLKSAADFITGDLPPECEAAMRKLREQHKQLEARKHQATKAQEATKGQAPRSQNPETCKKTDAEPSQAGNARLSKPASRIASDVDSSRQSFPSQRHGGEESEDYQRGGRRKVDLRSAASETRPAPKLSRSQSSKEQRRPAAGDVNLQIPRPTRAMNRTVAASHRRSRHEEESPPFSGKVRRSDSDPHISREMRRFNTESKSRNRAIDLALPGRESDLNPSKTAMLMSRLSLMTGLNYCSHDGAYDQFGPKDDREYLDNCFLRSHRLRNVVDPDSTPEMFMNCTLPISMSECRDNKKPRRHSMSLEDILMRRDNASPMPEETESENFAANGSGRSSADSARDTDVLKERFLRQTRSKSRHTSSQKQHQHHQLSASALAREARAARKQMEKMIEAAERTLGDGQEFVSPASRVVGGRAGRSSMYEEESDCNAQPRPTKDDHLVRRQPCSASAARPVSWTQESPDMPSGSKQSFPQARAGRRHVGDVDKERFWAAVSNTASRTTS